MSSSLRLRSFAACERNVGLAADAGVMVDWGCSSSQFLREKVFSVGFFFSQIGSGANR
jgi:hypothetical protein